MMYYLCDKVNEEFQNNLRDWYAGGPHTIGWTRTGDAIPEQYAKLTGYRAGFLSTDDILAKNHPEVERWHLDFLRNPDPLETTAYYQEYLIPRYSHEKAVQTAQTFLKLKDDIARCGIQRMVYIACCDWLGFPYFRFNGCHRTCAAKFLRIDKVPALIFTTEAPSNDE